MTKYLTTELSYTKQDDGTYRRGFVERELPTVPAYVHDIPDREGSRVTRMLPTDERGEIVVGGEPFPVRWDERLRAYVRA